jgi:hypothetical protein
MISIHTCHTKSVMAEIRLPIWVHRNCDSRTRTSMAVLAGARSAAFMFNYWKSAGICERSGWFFKTFPSVSKNVLITVDTQCFIIRRSAERIQEEARKMKTRLHTFL